MFTSSDYTENIMAIAIGDLRDFFHHDILDSTDSYNARQEVNSIDPTFGFNEDEGMGNFTTKLLDWLEQRKADCQAPWVARNGGIELHHGHCNNYLTFLEHWCASISGSMISRHEVQPEIRIQRLLRFATYIANNRLSPGAWRFTFMAADPKLLLGYASFLIVDAANHNLFVCYDDKRFARIGKDIVVRSALKQKAILHGLGLARTSLDWYLAHQLILPTKDSRIIAPPRREADACMYEYIIRALVSSVRTRIRYLLGMGDNEWTAI